MSADLLRRAAVRLREVAAAAKPGPWESNYSRRLGTFWLRSMAEFEFRSDAEILVAYTLGAPETVVEGTRANFAYFAALHPPVALALADLLDGYAEWFELPPFHGFKLNNDQRFIDLAREVLREAEVTPDA